MAMLVPPVLSVLYLHVFPFLPTPAWLHMCTQINSLTQKKGIQGFIQTCVDIPPSMDGSWYPGKVFIAFNIAAFAASSPVQHATELYSSLIEKIVT